MAVARTRTDKAPKGTTKPRGIEVPIEADPGAGGARRELLASEVLDKAAALFAKQGFAATSLKDVADAVGLHRSSIYYYYPNKDALLQELIQGVTLPVAQIFQEVDGEDLTPLTKIGEVVRRLVLWVSDPHTHFRLVERSEAELPDAVAGAHKEAKRHILREMMRLIAHRHDDVDGLVASSQPRAAPRRDRRADGRECHDGCAAHDGGEEDRDSWCAVAGNSRESRADRALGAKGLSARFCALPHMPERRLILCLFISLNAAVSVGPGLRYAVLSERNHWSFP